MSLLRYEPSNLINEIDRLLGQKFRLQGEDDTSSVETCQWIPAVDIKDEPTRYIIFADLPGIDKKDISISMEHNVLSIKGKRCEEKTEQKQNFKRVERVKGLFHRRFSLPETADGQAIDASIQNGVLEIIIPKRDIAMTKHIEIKDK